MRTTVPSTVPALPHGSLKDQAYTQRSVSSKKPRLEAQPITQKGFPRALETEVTGFQRPRAQQTPAVILIPELVPLQGQGLVSLRPPHFSS